MYMDHLETAIYMLQIFGHLSTDEEQQEIKRTLAFIEKNILKSLGIKKILLACVTKCTQIIYSSGSLSEYDRLSEDKKPPVFTSVAYLQIKFPQVSKFDFKE